MHAKRILALGLMALAACSVLFAQGAWREKDFRKWSEKECRKVLEDSPWARKYTHSQTYVELMGAPTRGRELQENPQITYIAQIRSALPIRQGLVRLKQLESGYDKNSPEQQKAFDLQAQKFLEQESSNAIVVSVTFSSNVMTYLRELSRHWEALAPEIAKKQILLIAPGRRTIYPLTYKAPAGSGAFEVTFPKQFDGKPVLSPQDKELRLEFPHPSVGTLGEAHVYFIFDPRKMTMDGRVVY